jgi:hypothetical protein
MPRGGASKRTRESAGDERRLGSSAVWTGRQDASSSLRAWRPPAPSVQPTNTPSARRPTAYPEDLTHVDLNWLGRPLDLEPAAVSASAVGRPSQPAMTTPSASTATDQAVRESLLWGGRFFFLDSSFNWLVWGMLCVRRGRPRQAHLCRATLMSTIGPPSPLPGADDQVSLLKRDRFGGQGLAGKFLVLIA